MRRMEMITEVVIEDGKIELQRWEPVVVNEYGENGCLPADYKQCPMHRQDGSTTSCVSRSGDSICGGYWGHCADNIVRCIYGVEP